MRNTEAENARILEIQRTLDRAREAREARDPLPNWEPLEAALPADELGAYMWMGTAPGPDGRRIQLYKHGITRRYLNLTLEETGGPGRPQQLEPQAWTYAPGGYGSDYRPRALADAVAHVLEDLEQLGATPTTAYTDEYRARRNRALRAAGYEVIEG